MTIMASMSRPVMASMMGSKDSLSRSRAALSAHVVACVPSLPCSSSAGEHQVMLSAARVK
jgi:hypothetical protein